MISEEYRPAIAELHRADRALFHLNHAEPQSEEWTQALSELFNGDVPADTIVGGNPAKVIRQLNEA